MCTLAYVSGHCLPSCHHLVLVSMYLAYWHLGHSFDSYCDSDDGFDGFVDFDGSGFSYMDLNSYTCDKNEKRNTEEKGK